MRFSVARKKKLSIAKLYDWLKNSCATFSANQKQLKLSEANGDSFDCVSRSQWPVTGLISCQEPMELWAPDRVSIGYSIFFASVDWPVESLKNRSIFFA